MSNFKIEESDEIFKSDSKIHFSFLGGLISGTNNHDFKFEDYHRNVSSNSIDFKIKPVPIGSAGAASKQTAYILGGIAEYYGK